MKPRYANRLNLKARYLGTLKGRKVFEWPVELTFGERAALTQQYDYPKKRIWVKSHTAAEAADFAATQDHCDRQPCVEISVWGPKAGLAAKRFWGWDRAIFNQMCDARSNRQLTFRFGGAR
jgi:hypothetical protein